MASDLLQQGNLKEVIFIDMSVDDWQSLADGAPKGSEIVTLDPTRDGLVQMAEWAEGREGYSAIHILSHGSAGQVQLGTTSLNSDSLSDYSDTLAQIGQSLTEDGDILLYGCEVAANQTGVEFIGKLAQATGADIAASDDLTGAESKGGDWALESVRGNVKASPLQSQTFKHLLEIINIDDGNDPAPDNLTDVNDVLFFSADDNTGDKELWKTDGVTVEKVKDINTTGDSYPSLLVNVNGTLFFTANNNANGGEIWKSDGTEQGTQLVTTLGLNGDNNYIRSFNEVNGKLFIITETEEQRTNPAYNPYHPFPNPEPQYIYELVESAVWVSDGTANGTVKLAGFTQNEIDFSEIGTDGTRFYFGINDGTNGAELWVSQGTAESTQLLKDINPGNGSSSPSNFATINGNLYFKANDGTHGNELWVTNGTDAGTVMVKDIQQGGSFASSQPDSMTLVGNTIYFSANDGVSGTELWKTDGTDAGTVLVKDIQEGSEYDSSSPDYLTSINGTLYFQANDGVHGDELWKSDGTKDGTVMVKDIDSGSTYSSSSPENFVLFDNTIYFTASDGVYGEELWRTDGTESGTKMVMDIRKGSSSSYIDELVISNGKLYFNISDANYNEQLWALTGNETVTLSNINGGKTFTEGSTPVVIDSDATIADTLLDSLVDGTGNYAGSVLTITRDAGAKAQDQFGASGDLGGLTEGQALSYNSTTVGSVASNSAGALILNFNSNATSVAVDNILQSITYSNTSNEPPASITLRYTFDGSVASDTATATVNIINIPNNEAPTVTGTVLDIGLVEEGTTNVDLSALAFADTEDDILTVTLSVDSGIFATPADGANVGSGVTAALNSGSDSNIINLVGSATDINAYLDTPANIQYTGAENVSGDNAATLTISATDANGSALAENVKVNLDITDVNDAPTYTGSGLSPTFTELDNAQVDWANLAVLFDNNIFNTIEAGQEITQVTLTVTNVSGTSDEVLAIRTGAESAIKMPLVDGQTGTINTNGLNFSYAVTVDDQKVATLIIDSSDIASVWNTYADNLFYANLSDNPVAGERVVTITGVKDNGGSENGGQDTTTDLNISSTVTVNAVNDAPVLDTSKAPALVSVPQNKGAPEKGSTDGSTLVGDIIGSTGISNYSDAEGGAPGIAIIGVSENGTLYYTTDGAQTWAELTGTVAESSALLLAADTNTRLYFKPDASYHGTLNNAISFKAWDGNGDYSNGQAGVSVTADSGNAFSGDSDTVSVKVIEPNNAPMGSVIISGSVEEGQTLTASNTLSDKDGLGTISYQWQRDGKAVDGATEETYTLTQADVNAKISVQASYTDQRGADESVTSAATVAVVNVNDAPTGSVTITGTAEQGATLTADNTLADEDGLGEVSYQWLRDNKEVTGATGTEYTLTQADVGAVISVRASYTDGLDAAEAVMSAVTAAVANVNDAPIMTSATSISVAENTTGNVYTAVGSDPDSDSLTYKLDGADAALFNLDSNSGALSFNNAPNFELPADENGDNVYDVTLTASDGSLSSSAQALAITVDNVNDAPELDINTGATVTAGRTVILTSTMLMARDEDDGAADLTYTLTALPTSGVLRLDGEALDIGETFTQADINAGQVSYQAARAAGEEAFVFSLADGGEDNASAIAEQSFNLTVARAPVSPDPDPIQVVPTTPDDPQPNTPSGNPSVSETITNTGRGTGTAKLVENSGNANEVTATLPGGVSLVNLGARTAVDSQLALADLINSIDAQQPTNLNAQTGVAGQWLANRPEGTLLDIRTLIISDNNGNSTSTPIQITGVGDDNGASNSHQEAFVIDVRSLPQGNQLLLDNIDFASIVGATTIRGGAGNNVVIGDDAAQTIVLGEGDDELHGGGGNDVIGSEGGDDRLFGGSGDDELFGGEGADLLHGGSDSDVASYEGNRDDYTISQHFGVITVQSKADASDIDTLINIETLTFADDELALSYDDDLQWITGLYVQVLGRQVDVEGAQYWAQQSANGMSRAEMALSILNSEESGRVVQEGDEFLDLLYAGLLGRDADEIGKAFWSEQIAAGATLSEVVNGFMFSDEIRSHDLDAVQWDFLV